MKPSGLRRGALWLLGPVLAAALMLPACSPESADFFLRSFVPMRFDKSAMLAESLDAVVQTGYRLFEIQALLLASALDRLAAQPDARSLEAARSSWSQTANAWVATEAYQFGPADEQRIRQQVHFWPRRREHIEAVLSSADALNLAGYGTTRRGLPVLEYLLYGPPAQSLTSPGGERARRYAALLAKDLVTQAQLLKHYWADPQQRAALSRDPAQLNRSLNQWVMLLEDSKNKRLGVPLGIESGQADPSATEAPDSQASLALLRSALKGFSQQYRGRSQGLDDYLLALGHRRLDSRIQAGIGHVEARLSAIEKQTSLEQALRQDPAAVRAAYDEMTQLLRLIKVDLANALNETVHFTDNDGD